jgi:hypothetical protein
VNWGGIDTLQWSDAGGSREDDMLWESLIGIVVFIVLVLLLGPEWWSSSLGTLKDKDKKKDPTPPKSDE